LSSVSVTKEYCGADSRHWQDGLFQSLTHRASNGGIIEGAMKVSYDEKTDTLSMILKDNTPIAESDEDKPGVILDYDAGGNLVSIEILDASKRVTETRKVEFQTTG
jgi:uncharacterized protein YuzE